MDDKTTKETDHGIQPIDTSGWKRCPFCGGEPRACASACDDAGDGNDYWGIATCHDCQVQFNVFAKTSDDVIAELDRLWNSRAVDDDGR